MEIRRELHHGELSEWRRAALPVATGIAFAVGSLALSIGKR
jgi:Na+:H+ antiporter, NhaA family